jgi:hypothetical protein
MLYEVQMDSKWGLRCLAKDDEVLFYCRGENMDLW